MRSRIQGTQQRKETKNISMTTVGQKPREQIFIDWSSRMEAFKVLGAGNNEIDKLSV